MPDAPYVHRVRIRYGEVDMQRVVFNAHYLAYCDDAADLWLRSLNVIGEGSDWDIMVKKATITWDGGAKVHDELAIAVSVSRWGNTSFDVRFEGTVDGASIFTADLTYVGVRTGTLETMPVPESFRTAVGGRSLSVTRDEPKEATPGDASSTAVGGRSLSATGDERQEATPGDASKTAP